MPGQYPFIDIAVLDEIREGFARGDALAVLTHDLSSVIWANGPGAALFGFDHIEDSIGNTPNLGISTRRQIMAQDGDNNGPRNVMVRLASGLQSQLVQLRISDITLPDGTLARVLASPTKHSADNANDFEVIISGFGSDNGDSQTHVALLDGQGAILASTPYFASLGIAENTLNDLAVEAADAAERTVKRRIRAGQQSIPGGVARLSDNPARNLLCIIAPSQQADELPVELLEKPVDIPAPIRATDSFTFNANAAPARFIWKTDADTVFSEISPEFAAALGPHAADVIGRRFGDVAKVFGFDLDDSIASLLERRDTWSGRRILWPIEGTDLRAPVELAALPTYSRDRSFMGFSGFGVIHLSHAEPDPDRIGIVLAGNQIAVEPEQAMTSTPPLSTSVTSAEKLSDKLIEKLALAAIKQTAPEQSVQTDDVTIIPPTELRITRPEGGLSKTERSAFREIAERLRRQGLASDQPVLAPVPAEPESEPVIAPTPLATIDEPQPVDPFDETPLLARLPVPIIIHSADMIHYANQALLDLTGYASIEDIIAAGGIDALFNADPDEKAEHQGMVLRHADGSEEPVNAHLQFVPWRTGRALMLSILTQSTAETGETFEPAAPLIASNDDEKNADLEERQALQTHIDELTTILDTATDGVVLIGQDGLIRSMNHSASALFGFEPEDVEGKNFSMLFAIESQRAAMDYLSGLSSNGVLSVLNDGREVIGREAQGRFIPMYMTIGKLPASKGYCAVLRDITQWKRAEEELTNARKEAERASSQKTEFLARISHEIRTPLNAIIGFSELMADEKFGPVGNQRYRDYLRDINRSGNHVLALVNDLLDISKIEAGGLEMQFEAVSLNDAISEAVALMQPQANRERVIIRSSFPSNLPDIVADARSIKQVALNLLSNAVRFTQAGGQVIVSTNYEVNGDVIMRVRDTGIGMNKAEVEQALKPFRQVSSIQHRKLSSQSDSSNDWRNEGTGLGLPLTKAMVEANRAQFSIDSAPGRGTVVEVVFPPTRVLAD